jgi:hypothetical protein
MLASGLSHGLFLTVGNTLAAPVEMLFNIENNSFSCLMDPSATWDRTVAAVENMPFAAGAALKDYCADMHSDDPQVAGLAWGKGMSMGVLMGLGLGFGTAGEGADAIAAETTAISPFRYTQADETFQHYSYVEHAESLAGGLRPASYGTTAEGLSGVEAQEGLALRHATPPDAVYTVSPPAGTPIRVNPITQPQFGQPGGLSEVEFILGTPPGSVSGPTLIPRGAR